MAKQNDREHVVYQGWFLPHAPVDWSGEILDLRTGELVKEPSMTKQSFKEECDINNIIKQYSVTGIWNHINERFQQGTFTDLPDPLDFQQSLEIAKQAGEAFASLPSSVRARFENDPGQFLEFMANPANQEEAIRLGLATDTRPPPKAPEPPQEPPEAE